MNHTYLLLLILFMCFSHYAHTQNSSFPDSLLFSTNRSLHLVRTETPIVLDGEMNEPAWQQGKMADQFWQNFPADSTLSQAQTEIYMCFDDEHVYVAAKCFHPSSDYMVPTLKRDYDFFGNDNISILFDTFNDKTNAFLFGMNPLGVRREALISNGGRQFGDFAESWDNKWDGESKIHDGYWIAEFAIPFKTIRFQEGSDQWRFNSYRFDTHYNEISSWIRIPRNQVIMDLGYMGKMEWEEPLQKPGANVSVIPYVIGGGFRDYTDPAETEADYNFNIGGDAKIAITPGLNLDLTLNPDFSQVEVDQQVTNLDRFEIFFPERRQFFLENADLFSSFGSQRVNPFFSRRIGVTRDTATGQNIQNAIRFGARLSGKLNEGLRVGLLNMQTAKEEASGLPGFNYTVAAVQQRVFGRSNISAIFVNKQAVNADEAGGDFNAYNRLAGIEYRIGSNDNRWGGKIMYHHVFSPEEQKHPFAHQAQVEYLRRDYRVEWAHMIIGNGFDAEVGFVPRRDYMLLSPEAEIYLYPKKGSVGQHTIGFDYRQIYKIGADGNTLIPEWGISDRQLEAFWSMQFKNNRRASIGLQFDDLILFDDFDPTRVQEDEVFLPAGASYTFTSLSGSYSSDPTKRFLYQFQPNVGQFFNGFRAGLEGQLTYRYQPYGVLSLDYAYNYIKLDDPFEPVHLWLVGPRIDLTFSKTLFLTTFVQYNSQFENLNINTRFQWRFQPVSDFFLVYTDNYLMDPFNQFSVRNRALVAKITYWLNL